jgi:UDP-N-acetylmuramate: L-alanyl-gamma-D-glutamyl-meso-diaminopimelate ligase
MNTTPLFDKRSKFVHYRLRTAVLNNPSSTTRYFENLAWLERQFHHRCAPFRRVIFNAQAPALQRVIAQGC